MVNKTLVRDTVYTATLLGTNISPLKMALLSRWFSFSPGGIWIRSLEGIFHNFSIKSWMHFFNNILPWCHIISYGGSFWGPYQVKSRLQVYVYYQLTNTKVTTGHLPNVQIQLYMGVSKNRGTPKWMVYKGKPHLNGWFGGTPFLETPI